MTTVNCAPMVRRDQQATNGIVHLIDKVLVPPPANGAPTLAEALFTDSRFRELSQMMLRSNYVNELRGGGPFTVFAPDDEAFQSISAEEMDRITGDPEARLGRFHCIIYFPGSDRMDALILVGYGPQWPCGKAPGPEGTNFETRFH
ncbi:hypothetical protein AVEN_201929-1 [Araneus ventricosus]|uniref:FAS1 domain-containing protein n=1 Tax=Araneus ventricosus TaxID=182803 RepID=A0A4Y2WY48_ARAVE|nr:hypothetical protein AVEN_201929-1 [Araneus ventricosus]